MKQSTRRLVGGLLLAGVALLVLRAPALATSAQTGNDGDAPAAEFAGVATDGCLPITVCFTDLSTSAPTSWLWEFGDGGTSAQHHPCHEYVSEGSYTVALTVSNDWGSDTEVKPDYVHAGPTYLIGYWPFDGNGMDLSGGARHLTLAEGTGFAGGLFGEALDLHGNELAGSEYAVRPVDDSIYDFGTGDFTVQVWVNFNTTERQQTLVEKFEGQAGPGWSLTKMEDDSLRFCWGGLGSDCNSPALGITSGVWHHILVRSQGGEFGMFYDGLRVASGCFPNIADTDMPLLVGKRNDLDGRNFAVEGRIDEVAIWDRALTDPEIAYLFKDGLGNPVPTCVVPPPWYEDDHPELRYSGDWRRYHHPAASAGHLTYSAQTGAAVDFDFQGTGLTWLAGMGPAAGMAHVYLDGSYVGTVDLYWGSYRFVTLSKAEMPAGAHSLRIEASGFKNPRSTGYFVDIDAFEVVP